jgi:hypothetical protein
LNNRLKYLEVSGGSHWTLKRTNSLGISLRRLHGVEHFICTFFVQKLSRESERL